MKNAASAWRKLTQAQKDAHGPHAGRARHVPREVPAAEASRTAPASGSSLGGPTPTVAPRPRTPRRQPPGDANDMSTKKGDTAAETRPWCAIQFGEFGVVSGRAPLGRGGYGQTLEVRDSSGQSLAMKLFDEPGELSIEVTAYDTIQRAIRRELLAGRNGPAHGMFLHVCGQCAVPPLTYCVLPLVPGTDLWEQMKARRISREEAGAIIWNAWIALNFLHRVVGMLHLDVKPMNMMWHQEKFVLLDFSLWERWPVPADCPIRGVYCTSGFRAPEISALRRMSQEERRMTLGPAVDLWSLGCTAACLAWASGDPPLRKKIMLVAWGEAQARDRDLDRVASRGSPLRPVLDMLLSTYPDDRGLRPELITRMIGQVQPQQEAE